MATQNRGKASPSLWLQQLTLGLPIPFLRGFAQHPSPNPPRLGDTGVNPAGGRGLLGWEFLTAILESMSMKENKEKSPLKQI